MSSKEGPGPLLLVGPCSSSKVSPIQPVSAPSLPFECACKCQLYNTPPSSSFRSISALLPIPPLPRPLPPPLAVRALPPPHPLSMATKAALRSLWSAFDKQESSIIDKLVWPWLMPADDTEEGAKRRAEEITEEIAQLEKTRMTTWARSVVESFDTAPPPSPPPLSATTPHPPPPSPATSSSRTATATATATATPTSPTPTPPPTSATLLWPPIVFTPPPRPTKEEEGEGLQRRTDAVLVKRLRRARFAAWTNAALHKFDFGAAPPTAPPPPQPLPSPSTSTVAAPPPPTTPTPSPKSTATPSPATEITSPPPPTPPLATARLSPTTAPATSSSPLVDSPPPAGTHPSPASTAYAQTSYRDLGGADAIILGVAIYYIVT